MNNYNLNIKQQYLYVFYKDKKISVIQQCIITTVYKLHYTTLQRKDQKMTEVDNPSWLS